MASLCFENGGIIFLRNVCAPTEHYLVVAKVRERLTVSKQTTHRVHMERFNLTKLSEVESKEWYHVEISNRFAALENLDTEVDVNKDWETIKREYRNFC
jgi:hypothetical protein